MSRLSRLCSCVFLLCGSAAASTYPIGAKLVLDAPENQRCLQEPGADRKDCGAIEESRRAYADAVKQMFEAGKAPDIELVLTVQAVEVYPQATGGLSLDLTTRVRVQSPSGEILDTIVSDGRAPVMGETPVADAVARAATDAARDFEVQYSRSDAVARFLVTGGAAPASALTIAPRNATLFWFAPAIGLHQGGDADTVPAASLRIGASYGWFMAQLVYGRSSASFEGAQSSGRFPATLNANDLGVDAGVVYRPFSALELRAGPGLHYLFGSAEADGTDSFNQAPASVSYARLSPTIFASLTTTFLPHRSGTRFFAGLEARGYFLSTVHVPEFGRALPAADWTLSALVGVELPWSRSSRASALGEHR
jgi:hypothetical protein